MTKDLLKSLPTPSKPMGETTQTRSVAVSGYAATLPSYNRMAFPTRPTGKGQSSSKGDGYEDSHGDSLRSMCRFAINAPVGGRFAALTKQTYKMTTDTTHTYIQRRKPTGWVPTSLHFKLHTVRNTHQKNSLLPLRGIWRPHWETTYYRDYF